MSKEMMICPKNRNLVDADSCIALKNLSKTMAEFFARKICTSVNQCPKEDYCLVFEAGWASVGDLFHMSSSTKE